MTTNNQHVDTLIHDEERLLDYINNDIIPCAACGENIDVKDSHRWVNRLVCSDCIDSYEGLDESDETNYDNDYEEETDA